MSALQAVSGMNDILPAAGEIQRWRSLEDTFRAVTARYGFHEVRTPLCEYTELFHRGVGDTTDIVEKEMYTFADRGGRHLSLRPEGTASAVRAAIEHSVLEKEPVVRWSYVGPMFRAERPAKGRYRQFHQVGAEVYGDGSAACDADVIDLAVTFLRALGITQFSVHLNSLGSRASRGRFRDALVAHFTPRLAELSPESQQRLARNPLRILDSKDPRDIAVREGAPSILDALDADDRAHFDKVCTFLDALGVPYTVNPLLVRGLDYYSRTVFELIDTSNALGAQSALGAGGRYDNLFTDLGGPGLNVPAVGFALGIERLLMAAPEPPAQKPFSVAVIAAAKAHETPVHAAALSLTRELRAAGFTATVDSRFVSIKSQMRRADDLRASVVLLLGGNELAQNTVTVKNMATSEQTSVARADLVASLTRIASGT